jgi:signal transduction histidine kinase
MKAALLSTRSSIGILCGLIFALELIAPTEYVFGHLYIAPLLLASFKIGQKGIWIVIRVAIFLTLLDLFIPNIDRINLIEVWRLPIAILVKFGLVSTIQSKVLNTISQSQKTSLQLVETLLDVYRNDADGLVLHQEQIDLWAIAKESIDSILILCLERQLKLNLDRDESTNCSYEIIGDRLQLSRVFSNLLSNAIYHSPRGEEINIAIHKHDRKYIVVVSDRGMRIDPANLPLLFERFYQAEDRVQGSGLGLYLSRQIVEAHGGQIWAEVKSPQGTNFCFSLPIGI